MMAVADISVRAKRLSLIAELVETFPTATERETFINQLQHKGIISDQVAALLRETYLPWERAE